MNLVIWFQQIIQIQASQPEQVFDFRIGMDITGGEGRLRTRAKYLVPNNPSNYSESDYTFDETTRDISFEISIGIRYIV